MYSELLIMAFSLEIVFITDVLNFHCQHLTEKVQRKQSAKLMQRILKDNPLVDIKAGNVRTTVCYEKENDNTKDLETAYLAEIENFLLKISQIKLKIN